MNRAERRMLVAKFTKQRVKDGLRQVGPMSKMAKKTFKKSLRQYVKKWADEDLKLHPKETSDKIGACLPKEALPSTKLAD